MLLPHNALFITAGAGSGKTYRLTNDLADYLLGTNDNEHNPGLAQIEPTQVIATTFTDAAASEIKERARQELLKKGDVQKATQIDTAFIGTTHSICQRFLAKYWYLLDSCPNQDVLTDEDKDIYRNQSLAKLMESNKFTSQRSDIQQYFNEFQPTHTENNILRPNTNFWAEAVDLIVHKATYYGITDFTTSKDESCAEIDNLFKGNAKVTDDEYAQIRADFMSEFKARGKDEIYKKLYRLPSTPTYHAIATLLSNVPSNDPDGTGYNTSEADKLTLTSWLTSSNYGDILKRCIEAVFDIADGWIQDYEDFKRRLGVIDFDDMEKGFYRLLDFKAVQDEIRETYRLVLVDEFQDCNPMQLKIFTRLSEIISTTDNRLPYSSIWVGDPNQSIYGFRGSDTDLINRVKSLFQKKYDKTDKIGGGLAEDTLDTSYRSRYQLVDHANGIFKQYFTTFTPLKHNPNSLDRDDTAIARWEFQQASSGDPNVLHAFACHIKDILASKAYHIQPKDSKKTDDKPLRNLELRDIAILARKGKEVDRIATVLREEGIPASAPEADILDRAEVQLILAILNLRTGAKDDSGTYKERPHELATLLRLWNDQLTEDIISERVDNVNDGDDWSAQHTTDIDPVRLALNHTHDLPLDQRIAAIILELDLYDRVSKWGDANVRRQNLMTLQSVAKQFVARCHRLSIQPTAKEFTLYLKIAKIKPGKDTSSDSVKVMTYHGSKGLEWPMVILTSFGYDPLDDLGIREFYGVHELPVQGSTGIIRDYYIHYIPAIAGSILEPHKSYIKDSSIVTSATDRIKQEEQRLLYVGITRARDYLVYYCTPKILKSRPKGNVKWEQDFKWFEKIGIAEAAIFDPATILSISTRIPPVVPAEWEKPEKEYPEYNELKEPNVKSHETATYRKYLERLAKSKADYKAKCDKIDEEYDINLKLYQDSLNRASAQAAEDQRRAALRNKTYDLHDLQPLHDCELQAKYLSPSKLPGKEGDEHADHHFQKLAGTTPIAIPENGANDIWFDRRAFGSCIHNIFAAYPYGSRHQLTGDERQAYLSTAQTIIRNYHLGQIITDQAADQLITNLLAMFQWLEQNFGPATQVVHEYPFNYPFLTPNSSLLTPNIVRGEIDLVYCTAKTDIIIDFKNYSAHPDWLPALDPGTTNPADFVDPHYDTQLQMYHHIWHQANPTKTIKTYLYYDILGGVVEV